MTLKGRTVPARVGRMSSGVTAVESKRGEDAVAQWLPERRTFLRPGVLGQE